MKLKLLALALAAALVCGTLQGTPAAHARDLVKATAALVLAEEPPLSRSQVLAKERKQAEVASAADKGKAVDTTPYYKKWWFWALTAAVVGGTVALGVWAVEPTTPPARACNPGVSACFGDGRMGGR